MQVQIIEASISSEVVEGEQLIWSGRSEPRGKSAVSPRKFYIASGICGVVGLILVILGTMISNQENSDPLFIVFLVVGFLLFYVALIVLFVGFVTLGKRFAGKNATYAITNRRVIIMSTGRLLRVDSYNKESIQQVRRLERPDESGDLLFSTRVSSAYGNSSNYNHLMSGQGAFTAIANVLQVEKKLIQMLAEI